MSFAYNITYFAWIAYSYTTTTLLIFLSTNIPGISILLSSLISLASAASWSALKADDYIRSGLYI
jgi:hypothetical protein